MPTSRDEVMLTSDDSLREIDDELTSFAPPVVETVDEDDRTTAAFVVGRWTRKFTHRSSLNLQFFHDRIHQYEALGLLPCGRIPTSAATSK